MHGIRLPEFAGKTEGEPPHVLLDGLRLSHHQPLVGEQAVDGRRRQRRVVSDLAGLPGLLDHLADAQFRRVTLD